jgi:DNA-binding MarR family transcriptional regulator/GNAT superfamily N-acetyltransferase
MTMPVPEERITAVRAFNRFFTRQIGALREGLLHSPYSLTEARVLYELAQGGECTASLLGKDLGLDLGYLSRLLAGFEAQGLVEKVRSESDGRTRLLRLTGPGREAFEALDRRSSEEVAERLAGLSEEDQRQLLGAMGTVQRLLGNRPGFRYASPFFLRGHIPGDMGWVIQRHGELYAREYGWDERFEALVAQICADFNHHLDPDLERCWVAEMNGERVGSVFLVRGAEEGEAKLRLLLVEARARGLGLGTRLVEECIAFARQRDYRKLRLWTNSVLVEARHIYRKRGFVLTASEPHHSFGQDLVGETWELEL